MLRGVLIGVLATAAIVGVAIVVEQRFHDDLGAPPPEYRTWSDGRAAFRYPPGWRVTRGRPAGGEPVVVVRPAGTSPASASGPVIELDRWAAGRAASVRLQALRRRLTRGERLGDTEYDLDVPGADTSSAPDTTFKTRDGATHRVTTAIATAGGTVTALTVRGRASDGPGDPRRVAGSLQLLD